MPNHVVNHVNVVGTSDKVLAALQDVASLETGFFTFNQVVPQPKDVEKKGGWYNWRLDNWGTKWDAYETEAIFDALHIKPWHFTVKPVAFVSSGKVRGYVKRINKKRLKKFGVYDEEITFWTAWSMPENFYRAWSERHPDVRINVNWADEDMGCNCGYVEFLAGDVTNVEYDGSGGDYWDTYARALFELDFDFDRFVELGASCEAWAQEMEQELEPIED